MQMVTLAEARSKQLLGSYGLEVAPERVVRTPDEAVAAAREVGLPVVVKLNGDRIAHKTERGLVRLNVGSLEAVREEATALLAAATPEDGDVDLIVARLVRGSRELIAGVVRDPQLGPAVMLGVGGVAAEALGDVAFRLVPLTRTDAHELVDDLAAQQLLGEFRGEPAVDRERLVDVLLALSACAQDHREIASIDVNPLIVCDGIPVAVDALVEADASWDPTAAPSGTRMSGQHDAITHQADEEGFRALFDPRGVIVAGASSHPGKFGFVALHNILAGGYRGAVFATNLQGEEVLGITTARSIDELPDDAADLVVVCTPAATNLELLRACAAKGVRAAFITSGGYAEAGTDGEVAQAELVRTARELGMLVAGPNGQGLVSTPVGLCAQIVAPYPPAGSIGIASQSGNLVSSFMNWASASGVGVSRAVSAGNAAAIGVADFLDFYADDPATNVGLAYVESLGDGQAFFDRLASVTARMPVVLVKGGATEGGARAAASHTGALASNDRVFDGACHQVGAMRATTPEEAFEAAATFATQPLPAGPNVVVMTTAGGWGVVTADAIARDGALRLLALPDDLRTAIDTKLPPRWSRNNPVDLAGGETRDTIPEVLELLATHPDVHSIVYLGLGIQSNQAKLMRQGGYYPDHGLERIVDYHERQDARFAAAAAAISASTGKPILTATELGTADPANAGPAAVRASGRLCYGSADRAVRALGYLYRYARFRQRRGDSGLAPEHVA
jgi:acyl-CoA synthetase (NDP forming)